MMEEKTDRKPRQKFGRNDSYSTPGSPHKAVSMPGLKFYTQLLFGPFMRLCWLARRGRCDDVNWSDASADCADILEKVGCDIHIAGMDFIDPAKAPYVFVANHMSTLETFVLPGVIRPRIPVTFVVKDSLVKMPLFGAVMRSREPIVVGRQNPREDLQAVLNEGRELLDRGISIIVFPQSTRSPDFDERHFNSIGVKLARKAGVPVIPLVLKTDAWGQGKKIRELGRIRPDLPIRFKFGAPLEITGSGKGEHEAICDFVGRQLGQWQKTDGVNR